MLQIKNKCLIIILKISSPWWFMLRDKKQSWVVIERCIQFEIIDIQLQGHHLLNYQWFWMKFYTPHIECVRKQPAVWDFSNRYAIAANETLNFQDCQP